MMKGTVGTLKLTHNELRKLLRGEEIRIGVENDKKINFTLNLSLEQFSSFQDLAEFIRDMGFNEPPEVEFD